MSEKKETIPSLDQMTMRDLAAFFAMQGLCACPSFAVTVEEISLLAYCQADAMLKERSK